MGARNYPSGRPTSGSGHTEARQEQRRRPGTRPNEEVDS